MIGSEISKKKGVNTVPISLEVWGDYACFSRPELKVERVSYDVMTPSAARGLLEAIYWHPGLRYTIDRIHVCAPIHFSNLRRNEVALTAPKISSSQNVAEKALMDGSAKIKPLCIVGNVRQQRATLLLRDVRYVIDAHFDMTDKAAPEDNPGKFQDILKRRITKGQFYHQPCFGCREFPAQFRLCQAPPPCPEELRGERDLGYMLWDLDYSDPQNITPLFFRGKLTDGVLNVPTRDSGEVTG